MRAVLDPNVLIAALLSEEGTPARILLRWVNGEFELLVSEQLIAEFKRACGYAKISRRVPPAAVDQFEALLRGSAELLIDPENPTRRSPDPGDDYLVALAETGLATLVSGDRHLLDIATDNRILSPQAFLAVLDATS